MVLGQFVRKVSKSSVVNGVDHIKKFYIPKQQLLSKNNPLVTNSLKAISKHANGSNPYVISNTYIKTFTAASSLGHMLDGWAYLSNSFSALLDGDEATAIHLAYYAELRSAMSILATEGLAVFNNRHIGLLSPNTSQVFKFRDNKRNATHQFVWSAMEKWSNSAFKPDPTILKAFTVKGLDFYELTEFFHPATAGSTMYSVETVKEWLKDWCFDIKAYRNDRESRNGVSYRPQRIKNFNDFLDFKNIITELANIWKLVSPSASDQFSLLDIYLLKKLYVNLHLKIAPSANLSDLVNNAFEQKGAHDASIIRILNDTTDPIIFQYARLQKTTALSIMSRATLLLRVSIGLVSQLYRSGSVSKNELNFVWNNYGVDNGFWSNGNQPLNFNELWTNIESSFNDLIDDLNEPASINDMYSLRDKNSASITQISQINRACLWGLNL